MRMRLFWEGDTILFAATLLCADWVWERRRAGGVLGVEERGSRFGVAVLVCRLGGGFARLALLLVKLLFWE